MFLDEKSIKYRNVNLFSSTLKGNVTQQAASRLLEHVTFNRNFYHKTHNSNGNAVDDYHQSSTHIQRNKKYFRRTDKCNSWLSNLPTKSDTSLNRLPVYIKSPLYKHQSPDYFSSVHIHPQTKYSNFSINQPHNMPLQFQPNQIILSSNATTNDINPQYESLSQPLIMIHKKRLRRDQFLSTMQNCIQPPYSQNHFYAFDQINMLKLQRSLHSTNDKHHTSLKRKYFDRYNDVQSQDDCSDIQPDQISLSKKYISSPHEQSLPKTADHISIDRYHNELKTPVSSNDKPELDFSVEHKKSEQSNLIVSHLEKILNLCTELRTVAKDVETHLNEQSSTKSNIDDRNPIEICQSERTTIDIYQELDVQPTINDPLPYEITNETLSIHSDSNKSHQLMPTESFKTKSPSLTTSNTALRKTEDICLCFLKSFLDKQNCSLNIDEQEYLNELTKAYLLGRQHREDSDKCQTVENEIFPDKQQESNNDLLFDTNNNNQSSSPSSILFYNNDEKANDHLSTTKKSSNGSIISLVENGQQELSTLSGIGSVKHRIFISEPIAIKAANALPGIGTKYAQQLAQCGFSTVRRLLGFYLMIKDDQHFATWLNNKVQLSTHSAWLCTNALRAWCEVHL
ncbi:unnamed protein product [Rotaria socialis]|uniref:Uncharacterized protein n=1 Tax=Rotaria socialis TaxID=392032 RepID=A0A817W1K6_9BILA|nr:unnamed protein product [Rotaria socialis]CAF3388650.1 unnamed protein product [Rotaria socialis]CAF3758010.1 unnamed protein product [Rotaria socialis]CAF4433600.1 unnamed protein product [Rotaria socialis]CAF4547606.1 unnamed protein product [Rotaria socialis]